MLKVELTRLGVLTCISGRVLSGGYAVTGGCLSGPCVALVGIGAAYVMALDLEWKYHGRP